ncbi:MAG: glutamate-5-semialdehyde dehydrogenase [Cellulosilyticaceae bacterium]
MKVLEQAQGAKRISRQIMNLKVEKQESALKAVAYELREGMEQILEANKRDLEQAVINGVKGSLLDRLTLTPERIEDMISGVLQILQLPNSIGEVENMITRPNGLQIGQKRVPIGVIGIIYEARPNVTVDAFALCFKTFNTVILRGGKEAFQTNQVIVELIRKALASCGVPADAVQLVQDTSRDSAMQLMKMNKYLDLLIPRGGAGLIQSVVENSTVPVIETGVGNCHIFIDQDADLEKAIPICLNAKAQRPGVCNAVETILIHKKIAEKCLNQLIPALQKHKVEIRGDENVCQWEGTIPAEVKDYETEFLDYIVAMKVVQDYEEAVNHIYEYSTGHSECILTENYTTAQQFLNDIDSAAVYVNASTRFTDGFEFGFGAEIGISTQKLHARGPMGLKALTTTKYIIYGNGQCRV